MSQIKKPRLKWTENAEVVLLELWEEYISDLRRQKRNSHVYSVISAKMKEMEFFIDPSEIHTKLANMTQRYRNETKVIGPSGGSRSSWRHYDRVHKILGCFPVHNINLIEESISSESQMLEPTEEFSVVDDDIPQVGQLISTQIPSSSASSACGTPPLLSHRNKRKLTKRKSKEELEQDFLKEIKRANDLTEVEMKETRDLKDIQLRLCNTLEKLSDSIINHLNKNN